MLRPSALRGHLSSTREAFTRHRKTKSSLETVASVQSRRGLDWTNFFIADVQQGFGAFVAFYLANLKWSPETIGLALTIGRITSAAVLIPGGALTDAVRPKRALVAIGIIMIAASGLILGLHPSFVGVMSAQVLYGLTAGLIGPAIGAISLGIVGRRAMSSRVGRNQRFDAAGNALTAGLMGVLGNYAGKGTIFLAASALTVPALVALGFIRKDEIDYDRARNAGKDEGGRPKLEGVLSAARNRQLLWFTAGAALFQLADASMLTLAVEKIGREDAAHSSLLTSGLIVVSQIVAAVLAPWVAYVSELWGRKPLLLVSFAAQVVRAILFGLTSSMVPMIVVQMLDGVNGAVGTVLTTVIVADLTTGTGRFNLIRGVVGLVITVAASVSTLLFGFVAQQMGDWGAFLGMAGVAAAGGLVVWFMLGETKPQTYID
jgi:MFS family permease